MKLGRTYSSYTLKWTQYIIIIHPKRNIVHANAFNIVFYSIISGRKVVLKFERNVNTREVSIRYKKLFDSYICQKKKILIIQSW